MFGYISNSLCHINMMHSKQTPLCQHKNKPLKKLNLNLKTVFTCKLFFKFLVHLRQKKIYKTWVIQGWWIRFCHKKNLISNGADNRSVTLLWLPFKALISVEKLISVADTPFRYDQIGNYSLFGSASLREFFSARGCHIGYSLLRDYFGWSPGAGRAIWNISKAENSF